MKLVAYGRNIMTPINVAKNDVGEMRLRGIADPTDPSDVATKDYVDKSIDHLLETDPLAILRAKVMGFELK